MKPLTIIAMIAGVCLAPGCLTYLMAVWWLAQAWLYFCLPGTDAERLVPGDNAGVTVGTLVSFAITSLILKMKKRWKRRAKMSLLSQPMRLSDETRGCILVKQG